jgi:broad specificity phosphatase PhoE
MPRGTLIRSSHWPSELVLVRHGESMGNLADNEAREHKAERLEIELRDADVPLSDTGQQQADAVGGFLAGLAGDDLPQLVVCSPYRRAAETAERALSAAGGDERRQELVIDERLRERDLGAFDRLTWRGIEAEYAKEAQRRSHVGKFYYQPPSGESWCDVTLRVRSLLHDLRDGYEGQRVWLFTHQAVIMGFRYVLEDLTESELLDIDKQQRLPNCSITTYRTSDGRMELVKFADTEAVDRSAAKATAEPSKTERVDSGG